MSQGTVARRSEWQSQASWWLCRHWPARKLGRWWIMTDMDDKQSKKIYMGAPEYYLIVRVMFQMRSIKPVGQMRRYRVVGRQRGENGSIAL